MASTSKSLMTAFSPFFKLAMVWRNAYLD